MVAVTAARTRTPRACSASTSPSAATSKRTAKPTPTPSPPNSTTALLGTLEAARDALIDSGHLAVVVAIETAPRLLGIVEDR